MARMVRCLRVFFVCLCILPIGLSAACGGPDFTAGGPSGADAGSDRDNTPFTLPDPSPMQNGGDGGPTGDGDAGNDRDATLIPRDSGSMQNGNDGGTTGAATGSDRDATLIPHDSGSMQNGDGAPMCSGNACPFTCAGATPDACQAVGCVDLKNDDANCGQCGNKCGPSTHCTAGACVCTPKASPCGSAVCGSASDGCGKTVACGSGCTPPMTCDATGKCVNTGCPTSCPMGEDCGTLSTPGCSIISCGMGTCTSPEQCVTASGSTAGTCHCTPFDSMTACGNRQCGTAPDGCGGHWNCGPGCGAGLACNAGTCCPTSCPGANCGARTTAGCAALSCGPACTSPDVCSDPNGGPGICTCKADPQGACGNRQCGQVTDVCGKLVNCPSGSSGTCGAPFVCSASTGACSCPSGLTACGGTCVDEVTNNTPNATNCGGCGAGFACGTSNVCCGGACIPLGTNTNCSACGAGCTAPNTCGGGGTANQCGCTSEPDAILCAKAGLTCGTATLTDHCGVSRARICGNCPVPDSNSGPGACTSTCVNNVCVCPGFADGFSCGPGGAIQICGGICMDLRKNNASCGGCGAQGPVCTSPETCGGAGVPAQCGQCPAGQAACDPGDGSGGGCIAISECQVTAPGNPCDTGCAQSGGGCKDTGVPVRDGTSCGPMKLCCGGTCTSRGVLQSCN